MDSPIHKTNPYAKIFFEISGFCQAKCPHCGTGNRSLQGYPTRFIPVKEFEKGVDHLLQKNLAGPETRFDLYNWGEPFLHPNLSEILEILYSRRTKYRLSTNAGIYKKIPPKVAGYLTRLTVTIPGITQASYNRVHRLSLEKVLENIRLFAEDLGSDKIYVVFLLHQFNLNEIGEAFRYFKKLSIKTAFTVAYLNDYGLARDYLLNVLTTDQMKRIGKDLFLSYIDELIASRPKNYYCPQYSILAIDEFCNVLTCCAVTKRHHDYKLGSLFNLSAEEIRSMKQQRKVCQECAQLGIDYWIQTPPNFSFIERLTGEGMPFRDLVEILKNKIIRKAKLLTTKRC